VFFKTPNGLKVSNVLRLSSSKNRRSADPFGGRVLSRVLPAEVFADHPDGRLLNTYDVM